MKIKRTPTLLTLVLGTCLAFRVFAQDEVANTVAPGRLPGNGLAQHDFLYAGEQKHQRMFIVRAGKVVWSYASDAKGEISDAVRMANGNVVFAHQFGVTMIAPDQKVLWNYDAPAGSEIHTAQPIGRDRVLFIQNGSPALLRVVNTTTGAIEREFVLPVGKPATVHPQFRHARLTATGTLLVAHMDMNKVAEYDADGKEVWSYPIPSPWSAVRLANGNTLIATNKKQVEEVTSLGRVVWQLTAADVPGYRISNFQIATRLPNGNTLVNNWMNEWNTSIDPASAEVQTLEITQDKKIVWALREWKVPVDLGPATTLQILDDASIPENVHFGDLH